MIRMTWGYPDEGMSFAALQRLTDNFLLQTQKGSQLFQANSLIFLAGPTGLEPATSGVTGRHSNQLNYRSELVGSERIELPTFAL